MATAKISHENFQVVPVIGDGALTGGMAMEALNQIGSDKRRMVIIFNDNNMSISENVGAMDQAFTKLRVSKPYTTLKHDLKGALSTSKFGEKCFAYDAECKKCSEGKCGRYFYFR